jgi:hypothetical protein
MVDWEGEIKTREDLLTARIRQLDQRALEEARAAENLERSRKENKAYFDQHKRLRGNSQLHVGDLVLLHTGKRQQSRVLKEKLDDYWRGPYRVRKIPEDSTFYWLEELDGTPLAKTIAGNRLKKFFSRTRVGNEQSITSEHHERAERAEQLSEQTLLPARERRAKSFQARSLV